MVPSFGGHPAVTFCPGIWNSLYFFITRVSVAWLDCQLTAVITEKSAADILLIAVILFWGEFTLFEYNGEVCLHFVLSLPLENCVDSKLTQLFRSVMDGCVLAADLSYPSIWRAFYYETVCVISFSKAAWHYQAFVNLSVAMKWGALLTITGLPSSRSYQQPAAQATCWSTEEQLNQSNLHKGFI